VILAYRLTVTGMVPVKKVEQGRAVSGGCIVSETKKKEKKDAPRK
jgi:hypothetical protein